jgi:hypothetical protein
MIPSFWVEVSAPLPAVTRKPARIDINPRIEAMSMRTQLNAGYTDASLGIDAEDRAQPLSRRVNPMLQMPANVPVNAHCVLYADGVPCFSGRATRRMFVAGEIRGFSLTGYGPAAAIDDIADGQPVGASIASLAGLADVLRNAAPLLEPAGGSSWTDTGTRHDASEFRNLRPLDALGLIAKSAPVAWVVYGDQQVQIISTTPPAVPDYVVPFDTTVTWDEDWLGVYDAGALIWNDGTTERVITVAGQTDHDLGMTRRLAIPSSAESELAARQYAAQQMREHAEPAISAQISRTNMEGLTRYGGTLPCAPWEVRAGQWVRVGDQPMQQITATQFDAWRGSLSVTLGMPLRGSLAALVTDAANAGRAIQWGRDVGSNARTGANT